jgi:KipI family sensor histidine kinase inhibitor
MNTEMNSLTESSIVPLGEGALLVKMGAGMDLSLNQQVHALASALRTNLRKEVLDLVPGYNTLLITFDPECAREDVLREWILEAMRLLPENPMEAGKRVEVPTVYGGEYGPDLDFVSNHCRMNSDEVIRLHCKVEYPVYFIGFLPGFPYLGGLDSKIGAPRLETPRQQIPAGSVGIAGMQTGIYPLESPGGWRLIGRTPLKLFDPSQNPPVLLQPGDRVRFMRYSTWDEASHAI